MLYRSSSNSGNKLNIGLICVNRITDRYFLTLNTALPIYPPLGFTKLFSESLTTPLHVTLSVNSFYYAPNKMPSTISTIEFCFQVPNSLKFGNHHTDQSLKWCTSAAYPSSRINELKNTFLLSCIFRWMPNCCRWYFPLFTAR